MSAPAFAHLRIHPTALDALRQRLPAPDPATPWVPGTLGSLIGIPVIADDGMTPGAWRLTDADGAVVRQGITHVVVEGQEVPDVVTDPG